MLYFDTSAVLLYYRQEHASDKDDRPEDVECASLSLRRTSLGSPDQ